MSYASPEGSVERNDDVSNNRMKSTVKYTRHLLKKFNVEGAENSELYTETSVGEDWDGFESIIKSSEIKDKRKINNLLQSVEDVDKREVNKPEAQAYNELLTPEVMKFMPQSKS